MNPEGDHRKTSEGLTHVLGVCLGTFQIFMEKAPIFVLAYTEKKPFLKSIFRLY